MDYTRVNYVSSKQATQYDEGLRTYMLSVFVNMGMALGITGIVSYAAAMIPALQMLLMGPLGIIVALSPLAMVFFIRAKIMSYSVDAARIMLGIFAALIGLSLSYIFIIYTGESVARTFFVTASLFGAMSLYGYTTKKDLTSFGSFLMMGLLGIIIASLVNLFMQSAAVYFVTSVAAVIIFTGLTAFNVQSLKQTYYQVAGTGEIAEKIAVYGALGLYLDFINLFVSLLRFFGDRR